MQTALRLLRAEGLERVSLRRLAGELDTGPASLYVYVDNLADLHGAILDRLLSEVDLGSSAPEEWRSRLIDLLTAYTELLFAHPSLARSVLALRPSGPNYLRLADSVLVLLRAGGVPPGQAAWGVSLLLQLAVSTAAEHGTRRDRGDAGPAEEAEERSWRQVPAGQYPGIAWASPDLFTGGNQRMPWAFHVLIDGLVAGEHLPARCQ